MTPVFTASVLGGLGEASGRVDPCQERGLTVDVGRGKPTRRKPSPTGGTPTGACAWTASDVKGIAVNAAKVARHLGEAGILLRKHFIGNAALNWQQFGESPAGGSIPQRSIDSINVEGKSVKETIQAGNHTPGPWYQDHLNCEIISAGEPGDKWEVARCNESFSDEEFQANVHLIAAAPELLEACKFGIPNVACDISLLQVAAKILEDLGHCDNTPGSLSHALRLKDEKEKQALRKAQEVLTNGR